MITFLTLFLGLTTGLHPVELVVGDEVARVADLGCDPRRLGAVVQVDVGWIQLWAGRCRRPRRLCSVGASFRLWAINAGYHTLAFTLFGLVFGWWP